MLASRTHIKLKKNMRAAKGTLKKCGCGASRAVDVGALHKQLKLVRRMRVKETEKKKCGRAVMLEKKSMVAARGLGPEVVSYILQ